MPSRDRPKLLTTLPFLLALLFSPSPSQTADYFKVKRVVDGDTIVLDNDEKVRLILLDTPRYTTAPSSTRTPREPSETRRPSRSLGKKASAFTKKLPEGKQVLLEHDQASPHTKHRDRYGRLLPYVYLNDGTFVNAEIIRQGYGNAYTQFPFK